MQQGRRARRLIFLLPVVGVAALAIGFAFLLTSGRNRTLIPSVMIDLPAPQFDLPALAGLEGVEGLATADFSGQVSLVNFFASWCVPCLAEHPLITALAANGVRVYGINHRDPPPGGVEWLARHGNPYARVGADHNARISLDWGVTGVPETFIVDAAGVIRYRHVGPLTARIIDREVRPIVAELTSIRTSELGSELGSEPGSERGPEPSPEPGQ